MFSECLHTLSHTDNKLMLCATGLLLNIECQVAFASLCIAGKRDVFRSPVVQVTVLSSTFFLTDIMQQFNLYLAADDTLCRLVNVSRRFERSECLLISQSSRPKKAARALKINTTCSSETSAGNFCSDTAKCSFESSGSCLGKCSLFI